MSRGAERAANSPRAIVLRYGLPILACLALTLAVFAPLLPHLHDGVLRGPTDGAQVMRLLWSLERQDTTLFTAERDSLLGAPEGLPLAPALSIAQPVQPAAVTVGAEAVGEVLASNLFLLAGFLLTAFASFVLLWRLRLHPIAAFFGASLIAFNPWMVERALEGHAAFVHAWPLVMLIDALVAVYLTRSPRSAALAGAAFGLSFLTAAYLGLLATLVVLTFMSVTFIVTRTWSERLWVCSLLSVVAGVLLIFLVPGALAYLTSSDSVNAVASHSSEELGAISLSDTLKGYLRPAPQHPVLGRFGTEPRFGTANAETVLFVGFTTLALAAFGAYGLLRRRSPLQHAPLRYALTSALVLAPAAFLLSLPPRVEVGGIGFPLPSRVLAELTSFYRVYTRFGFLVLVALALLAAAAVHLLLQRRHGVYLAAAAAAAVAFELFPGLLPVWSPSERESDRWLAAQRPGIVANYPMPTDQYGALELALEEQFRQRFHGQPLFTLVGPGIGGTREEAIRLVTRYVTAPETPGMLAAEGIRYVLLHDDVFRLQGEQPPEVPPGFRLVRAIGGIRLLELRPDVPPADVDAVLEQQAAAIAAVQGLPAPATTLGQGFSPIPGSDRHRVSGEGVIQLAGAGEWLKRVLLLVQAHSPAGDQTIQLLDESGNLVGEAAVGTEPATVALGPIPIGPSGARLRLRTAQELLLAAPTAQPLADFSVSLRDRR